MVDEGGSWEEIGVELVQLKEIDDISKVAQFDLDSASEWSERER